ncbi:MAG: proton-conducting transporter membrane subunit, partial [Acidimicrobiales bacterium]
NNMSEMGGLRKHMPTTFWTFLVGSVALAGIFPLAGFWSKDEILLGASENGFPLMLVVGLIGAFMTAAYMTRACYLIFAGEYRGHGHPHEAPPSMAWSLRILAVPAVLAGLLNAPGILLFNDWVAFEVEGVEHFLLHHDFNAGLAAASLGIVLLGIAAASAYYFRGALVGLSERIPILQTAHRVVVNKYYLDHLFLGIIRAIQYPIARAAYWTNQHVLDGVVNGVGKSAERGARVVYDVIDQRVIDGAVNGAGLSAEEGGSLLRYFQTGRVQQYAAMLFGAVAVLAMGLVAFT